MTRIEHWPEQQFQTAVVIGRLKITWSGWTTWLPLVGFTQGMYRVNEGRYGWLRDGFFVGKLFVRWRRK